MTDKHTIKLFDKLFFTPNILETLREIKESNMIYEVAPNNPRIMWLTNSRTENIIQINNSTETNKTINGAVFSLDRILRFILSPLNKAIDYTIFCFIKQG